MSQETKFQQEKAIEYDGEGITSLTNQIHNTNHLILASVNYEHRENY